MFQLSLASKELFHSNFLFWIWQLNHKLFKTMIQKLTSDPTIGSDWPSDYILKREYNHYDLCVLGENNKVLLVIENKVKSIPTLKQLNEYLREGHRHVLLSLSSDFPEKEKIEHWEIVNYETLSKTLKELSTHHAISPYHKSIIDDYSGMIHHLHQVQLEWSIDANADFFNSDNNCVILRINDIKEKIRFSKMLVMLKKLLVNKLGIEPDLNTDRDYVFNTSGEIFINWGMTRGMGLLEVKIPVEKNIALVIQIQGDQYRHAVELYGFRKKFEDNWNDVLQDSKLNWFFRSHIIKNPFHLFSNSELPLTIWPKKGGCNHYRNEFLYQSIKIPANTKISELLDMIVTDCQKIKELTGMSVAD